MPDPPQRSWDPWELTPVEVPGPSDELVAVPVMMAVSGLGTPAVQRIAAFSVMAGRLAQIATRI